MRRALRLCASLPEKSDQAAKNARQAKDDDLHGRSLPYNQQQRISHMPPPIRAAARTNHQKEAGRTSERMMTRPAQTAIMPHRLNPFLRIKTRPFALTDTSLSERASIYDSSFQPVLLSQGFCFAVNSYRRASEAYRLLPIFPSSSARRTAQSGSLRCAQSKKRHFPM